MDHDTQQQIQRHELKFYIDHADYAHARSVLDVVMKKDPNQENARGYWIRSLYLDDIDDSSVEDKLAGIEDRTKYRLRIYDTAQDWAKLEQKKKLNNYVQKTAVHVSRDEAYEIAAGDYTCLQRRDDRDALTLYVDLVKQYRRPVAIIDYMRDTYCLDYNNIRITFDTQLRASNTDLDLFATDTATLPLLRPEAVIMEIKFNHFLPPWFTQLMQLDGAISSAISKYTISRMESNAFHLSSL